MKLRGVSAQIPRNHVYGMENIEPYNMIFSRKIRTITLMFYGMSRKELNEDGFADQAYNKTFSICSFEGLVAGLPM